MHLIRDNRFSAETAYEFKALEIRAKWGGTGNVRLRERLADLLATQLRVLRHLTGQGDDELFGFEDQRHVIIVAHELYPGLTVQLDRDQLAGLVSEEGTRTSHAAILAHSLGIPCVMGVSGAAARIKPGTMLLLDGTDRHHPGRADPPGARNSERSSPPAGTSSSSSWKPPSSSPASLPTDRP